MTGGPGSRGRGRGSAEAPPTDPGWKAGQKDAFEEDGSEESSWDEDEDLGGTPESVHRHCTDAACLLPFLLALGGLALGLDYCLRHGDLRRFWAFEDVDGKLCNRSSYLYFCMHQENRLNLSHPICVAHCPNDNYANHSFQCEANGVFVNTTDYSTEPYFNMVCDPMVSDIRSQMQSHIVQSRHIFMVRLLLEHVEFIIACAFVGVAASCIYLSFLGHCAKIVVWLGLTVLTLVPLAFGLYLMGFLHLLNLAPAPYVLDNVDLNFAEGVGLCLLSCSVACCSCRMSVAVDKAMKCLEDAILCVMQTPVLQFQPIIHILLSCAANSVPVACLLLLLSCQDAGLSYTGGAPRSLPQHMMLTTEQTMILVALVCLFLWIQQIIQCLSSFVVTYTAQLWYFHGGRDGDGYVHPCYLCEAYRVALRYHSGTMVLGALVIGLTRPLRLVLSTLHGFSELRANPVGQVVGTICCLCMEVYEQFLEALNPNAQIEVALNSRPFCRAAVAALDVINSDAETKRMLHGCTWVFQLAGIALIGALGALSLSVMRAAQGIGEGGARQELMLAKLVFLVTGASVAICVCFPFMMLFDNISDTILYCRTVERLRAEWRPWDWTPDLLSCVCCVRDRPNGPAIGGSFPPPRERVGGASLGNGRARH